ncbi:hypothetical protein CDAR_554131 [Caerostris darwini]|uniref:Uncharacterized protein n=1 Tax=Caerostris darwini TaxID=1538125 RepID=A0AAV4X847_9ARAC|nr:hypothetical protein CDAR_554131 [Caerostris darwini]
MSACVVAFVLQLRSLLKDPTTFRKVFLALLILGVVLIHPIASNVFNHDIMSEDDATYGLPSIRVRRDTLGSEGRLGGPLYTHIKTDSGGTFKWGTKHMVGKMFSGDKQFDEEFGF